MTLEDGKSFSLNDTVLNSEKVKTIWHESIGYYFPNKASTSLSVMKQQGSWHEIADPYSSKMVTGKVFKLWINQGINAINSAYEYLVLPDVSPKQLADYAQKPGIEILINSKTVQGVKLNDNSLFQFVFHEPTRITTFTTSDFIEAKTPGLVMMERIDSPDILLTVVDPTQSQKEFRLIVSGKYEANYSNYNPSTNQTELIIPLPQNEYAGSPVTVSLKNK